MGKQFDQLNIDERYELYRLREDGKGIREIGRLMGRSEATISRELRRNALSKGEYKPASALALGKQVMKLLAPTIWAINPGIDCLGANAVF